MNRHAGSTIEKLRTCPSSGVHLRWFLEFFGDPMDGRPEIGGNNQEGGVAGVKMMQRNRLPILVLIIIVAIAVEACSKREPRPELITEVSSLLPDVPDDSFEVLDADRIENRDTESWFADLKVNASFQASLVDSGFVVVSCSQSKVLADRAVSLAAAPEWKVDIESSDHCYCSQRLKKGTGEQRLTLVYVTTIRFQARVINLQAKMDCLLLDRRFGEIDSSR